MDKTAAIVGICFFGMICAFMCAMPYMLEHDDIGNTPTPKSECGMDFDGVREFENVQIRFMSYTFDVSGKIEQIGDTYYVKCGGWNDDKDVYAIIVNEVIDGEDYGLAIINHGYGGMDYDYEISDRNLKEMVRKSVPHRGD